MSTRPAGVGQSVPVAQPLTADLPPSELRPSAGRADTFEEVKSSPSTRATPKQPAVSRAQAESLALEAAPGLGIKRGEVASSFSGGFLLKLRASARRLQELEAQASIRPSESRELGELWAALDRFAYPVATIEAKVPATRWESTQFVDLAAQQGGRFLLAVDASGAAVVAERK